MKMVSVAQKLSIIKEKCPNQSFCFGREIAGTLVTNPKIILGWNPGEDVFCTLETDDGRRTLIRPTLFVSVRRL
jgi:hypothetical protein